MFKIEVIAIAAATIAVIMPIITALRGEGQMLRAATLVLILITVGLIGMGIVKSFYLIGAGICWFAAQACAAAALKNRRDREERERRERGLLKAVGRAVSPSRISMRWPFRRIR